MRGGVGAAQDERKRGEGGTHTGGQKQQEGEWSRKRV